MFSEEVKQVTYLAITCMLLAIVLTFASQLMSLKNDMVGMRNDEIMSNEQVVYMREFAKYNSSRDFVSTSSNEVTNPLTGLDIIEAITEYQNDTNICIYVDKTGFGYSASNVMLYSKKDKLSNPSKYTLETLQNLYTGAEQYGCVLLENLPNDSTSTEVTEESAKSALHYIYNNIRYGDFESIVGSQVRKSDAVPVRAMFFFRSY